MWLDWIILAKSQVSGAKFWFCSVLFVHTHTFEFDANVHWKFTLVCPVRRGANRHLPSTVSPGAADHREGGCSQQLCARSLHHRQGNCRFGTGSHQETCKCNRVAGSCELLNVWHWFNNNKKLSKPFFLFQSLKDFYKLFKQRWSSLLWRQSD